MEKPEHAESTPVRVYKTPIYTRNASKAYQERYPERVRACKERYNEKQREIRRQEKAKLVAQKKVVPPAAELMVKFFTPASI